MNYNEIQLEKLNSIIFSETAEAAARDIEDRNVNKATQIRKFYDELNMWNDKVIQSADPVAEYEKLAPFIHMMKAKVAYSFGRKHVNQNFLNLFNQIISEIKDEKTLRNAKLFFEAVLGFKKANEEAGKR